MCGQLISRVVVEYDGSWHVNTFNRTDHLSK
jgi:hypothetical protein